MFTVVPMTLSHLDEVYAVETDSFAIPWSKNEIRRDFSENPHAYYYVALAEAAEIAESDDKRVVGYAGMWHIVNEGHINNIAVAGAYRRRGIGALLMERLLQTAREQEMVGLTLEVRVGNRAAMGLYHKYGFKAEGLRKNYYADTKEDAVIMWKYLYY